jgi:hypothetical protein
MATLSTSPTLESREANRPNEFRSMSFDVRSSLPDSWDERILDLLPLASEIQLSTRSVTSREGDFEDMSPARFLCINGQIIKQKIPWITHNYQGIWLKMAQRYFGLDIVASSSEKSGAVLNALVNPEMRYEAHVDSNPLTALLFVTTIEPHCGGELIVARKQSANSIKEIEESHISFRPERGKLLLFDGRNFPHYVRPLKYNGRIRCAIAMNYYNKECPESARPIDLDNHLGL